MFLYRVITFLDYTPLNTPQRLLEGHSRTITFQGKQRVFTVRKVFYDDDMTPLWTEPGMNEIRCECPLKLASYFPQKTIWDSPILDNDHSLKTYNHEQNR